MGANPLYDSFRHVLYGGPLVKENVLIGKAIMEGNGDAAQYWHNVMANAYTGLLQIVLLTVVTIVSVYKPWKRKGH